MPDFTKGPWEIGRYDWPSGTISYHLCGPVPIKDAEGNRLLIQGAPDLLEALKAVADPDWCTTKYSIRDQDMWLKKAALAIRKAEGKS